MARAKKWEVPFVSLNGTMCRVDIYEEGYSGSVTALSVNNPNAPGYAAAVPFEIQEDDSNDLTQFIRFKTGFLRLKEKTYGGLAGLMPRSLTDHYLEAYYGSELVFRGFMQCQEFDDSWVAAPRLLEFPIISPLGLLDAYNFTAPSEPELVTLGELMHEVVTGLNGGYEGVIYPLQSSYKPWTDVMSSTVVVPFNEEFKHYDQASNLYKPKDYRYFIEGICACFGWMVHDTPTDIVFTKYDYTGNPYSRLTVAGLLDPASGWSGVQQRAASFDSYYRNADNNAMQSVIMPVKRVNLSLEGVDIKDKRLGTDHAVTYGMMGGTEVSREVTLDQVGPDVFGNYVGRATFDTGGDLYNNGVFPIAYGKVEADAKTVSMSESWVIKYLSSWSTSYAMLTAKFYGQAPKNSNGYCLLKLAFERGTSLQSMEARDYDDFSLNLVIKSGGKYFNLTNDTWASSFTMNSITIDGDTGKVTPNKAFPTGSSIGVYTSIGDVDGIMFTMPYGIDSPVEISLYNKANTGLDDNDILRITDLSLANPGAIDEPYNAFYRNKGEIVVGSNPTGVEEKNVTVNFNDYSMNRGENSFGDEAYGPQGSNPTFPYLFTPMTVLTEKVKRTATPDFNEYAARWTYWISGWRWRMIAKNFSLRDDMYQITLARSTSIE